MSVSHKICEICGKKYKVCKACEENYSKLYYTWRQHYCSRECCYIGFGRKESGNFMKIQYEGLMYGIESYDLEKDIFELPNGKKVKSDEIQAFVMTPEVYKKVLAFVKPVKAVKKAEVVTEE